MRQVFSFAYFLGCLFFAVQFTLTGCEIQNSGDGDNVVLTVEPDSAYYKFGKLWVGIVDSAKGDTTVIFPMDSLSSAERLKRIPIKLQDQSPILILIRGYESGTARLIYEETRELDPRSGALVANQIKLDLDKVRKMPYSISLGASDTLVSIFDSVRISATIGDSAGIINSFAWDPKGSGSFGPEYAFDSDTPTIRTKVSFPDSGRYPVLLRVKTRKKNVSIDTIWIRVVLDRPRIEAGPNQEVNVGDTVRLKATFSDGYGKVTRVDWRLAPDSVARFKSADTFFIAPDSAQYQTWIARATDDDGLTGEDTVFVVVKYRQDALLAGLEAKGTKLNPDFDKNRTAYTADVPFGMDSLAFSAMKDDPKARAILNDVEMVPGEAIKAPLSVGTNLIRISVLAQSGVDKQDYVILVTRRKNTDSDLGSLDADPGKLAPDFSKSVYLYRLSLESSEEQFTLTPRAFDSTNAKVYVNGTSFPPGAPVGPFRASVGVDTIRIKVVAQNDSDTSLYTILVSRAPSRNSLLQALETSAGDLSPKFSPDIIDYKIEVPSSVSSLSFLAKASASLSNVFLNGESIDQGGNTHAYPIAKGDSQFRFKVVSESGDSGIYLINVHRRSDIATLGTLSLDKGILRPEFDPNAFDYKDTVKGGVDKIRIHVKATDPNAKSVQISSTMVNGSESEVPVSVSYGDNTIFIKVTAEDGQTRDYRILIHRQSNDDTLNSLVPNVGILVPPFAPSTLNYNMTIGSSVDSLSFKPSANSDFSTITLNGTAMKPGLGSPPVPLRIGENPMRLIVCSESGDTLIYSIQVHRKSADADLRSLAIDAGRMSPAFKVGTQSYVDSIPSGVKSVRISAKAANPLAQSISIQGNIFPGDSASLDLAIDPFSMPLRVKFVVKAEDGTEKASDLIIRGPGFFRTFGSTNDDNVANAVQTRDGGYACIGYSVNAAKAYQMRLIKINVDGDTSWTKAFDENSAGGLVLSMSDGGLIAAGYVFLQGATLSSIYLVRMDSQGNVQWTKTIGGPRNYAVSDIIELADGGFIIAGNSTNKNNDRYSGFLARTNSLGDTLWTNMLGDTTTFQNLMISSMIESDDGGYLVTGAISFDALYSYALLIKTDAQGKAIWQKRYFPAGSSGVNKISSSPGGGYLLAGNTALGSASVSDGFILSVGPLGDSLGTKGFASFGANDIVDMQATPDGGFILLGRTTTKGSGGADFLLMKTDASFNLAWSQVYGGPGTDSPFSVVRTSDGGYFLTGSTVSFGAGKSDWLVIKTDDKGNAK